MNKLTSTDYPKRFKEVTDQMFEITTAKNHDYSGTTHAFNNFDTIEQLTQGGVSAEHGLLVRITDKLTRITNLLSTEAKVKDEKITDTLLDMANYAIILKIYIETKGKENQEQ